MLFFKRMDLALNNHEDWYAIKQRNQTKPINLRYNIASPIK